MSTDFSKNAVNLVQWCQMVTVQSVQRHMGHSFFNFFDIRALLCSGLCAGPEFPNVKKIKKGRLDQYGAERFDRLIFATIRKKFGTETVKMYKVCGPS